MPEAEPLAPAEQVAAEREHAGDSSGSNGALVAASLPRLPPELLSHILSFLAPSSLANDPLTHRTLSALACVSHLTRHWALQVRYETLLLPRHVRDFRKWYARIRGTQPPFVCAGYTRGLFSGLDDVSADWRGRRPGGSLYFLLHALSLRPALPCSH